MMPLSMMNVGDGSSIKKVSGKEDVRQFLETLGFIPGTKVRLITKNAGNVIVGIKESRVAISREMAMKIMV
ncbi:MAG: ferrous iron transport protein A [Lachnospiraceae bacterium]|nr:ferrous iron transport protein A [Lachnospiraceae bacterium]